jgi:hypothetical protein
MLVAKYLKRSGGAWFRRPILAAYFWIPKARIMFYNRPGTDRPVSLKARAPGEGRLRFGGIRVDFAEGAMDEPPQQASIPSSFRAVHTDVSRSGVP